MSERKDKYWICKDCADKKKWTPPNYNVTVIKGLCGWCEREDEAMLIPVVDFRKVTNE